MANTATANVAITPSNVISANVKHGNNVMHEIRHDVNFVINVVTQVNNLISEIQGLLARLHPAVANTVANSTVTLGTVTSNTVANTK